jgi:predicted Zn-dependent protease
MALPLIERAITQAGPYPELLDTQGVVLLEAGQHDMAVQVLNLALKKLPAAAVYLHLAEAEHRAGNLAAARAALKSAEDAHLDPAVLHPIDRAKYDELTPQLAGR